MDVYICTLNASYVYSADHIVSASTLTANNANFIGDILDDKLADTRRITFEHGQLSNATKQNFQLMEIGEKAHITIILIGQGMCSFARYSMSLSHSFD